MDEIQMQLDGFEELFKKKVLNQDKIFLSENSEPLNDSILASSQDKKMGEFVDSKRSQITKKKRNYKSKLWGEKNTDLFYRLCVIFQGSLDLIYNYFQQHVDKSISMKKIKQKFKEELKNNPKKLFDTAKKPKLKEKIQQKLLSLARMQDLALVQKWSQVSEIDNDQIQGADEHDTQIQQNIYEQINQMLKKDKQQKHLQK